MAPDADRFTGNAARHIDPMKGRDDRSDFFRSLGDATSRNPVAAALIGMGALWLFMGGSRTSLFSTISGSEQNPRTSGATGGLAYAAQSAGVIGRKVGETVSKAASRVSDAISSAHESVGAETSRTAEMAPHSVHEASQRASSRLVRTAQQDLAALYERQPLLLGALGIAIGAGIAAAFPATEFERSIAGEASDEIKAKASSFASEGLGKAETVAKKAVDQVKREAEAQL
jgi:hypothetical protein